MMAVAGITPDAPASLAVELPAAGTVSARIVDERGGPIPCKVQFLGRDGRPAAQQVEPGPKPVAGLLTFHEPELGQRAEVAVDR